MYDGNMLPIAKALDFTEYSEHGAHAKKHLVTFIMNERGIKHTDKVSRSKIEQEVSDV